VKYFSLDLVKERKQFFRCAQDDSNPKKHQKIDSSLLSESLFSNFILNDQ